jgi:hypothetical protein
MTETLPSSIQYLSNLNVALNSLTGTIPNGVENWTNILYATLNDNHFTGTIPQGVCTNVSNVVVDFESILYVNCTCCKSEYCEKQESNLQNTTKF